LEKTAAARFHKINGEQNDNGPKYEVDLMAAVNVTDFVMNLVAENALASMLIS